MQKNYEKYLPKKYFIHRNNITIIFWYFNKIIIQIYLCTFNKLPYMAYKYGPLCGGCNCWSNYHSNLVLKVNCSPL